MSVEAKSSVFEEVQPSIIQLQGQPGAFVTVRAKEHEQKLLASVLFDRKEKKASIAVISIAENRKSAETIFSHHLSSKIGDRTTARDTAGQTLLVADINADQKDDIIHHSGVLLSNSEGELAESFTWKPFASTLGNTDVFAPLAWVDFGKSWARFQPTRQEDSGLSLEVCSIESCEKVLTKNLPGTRVYDIENGDFDGDGLQDIVAAIFDENSFAFEKAIKRSFF